MEDDSIAVGMSRETAYLLLEGLRNVGHAYRQGNVTLTDKQVNAMYDLQVILANYINDNEEDE